MLKNIEIKSESGQIRIFWEWDNEEVSGIDIRYKKRGFGEGDGTEFAKGGVIRHPGERTGNACRRLVDECGLYTFTFIPIIRNRGQEEEKVVVENVVLGNPINIYWRLESKKEGTVIAFPENQFTIGPGIVKLLYGKYEYVFQYEISSASRLLFPQGVKTEKLLLQAAEPYDRIYRFVRR